MQHLNQEELILVYYGETAEPEHLAACPDCRGELRALAELLDRVTEQPAPQPPADLAGRIWTALPIPRHPRFRRFAWPAAIAAMVVIAFQAGRHLPATNPAPSAAPQILLVALPDHLERAGMVLTEIANAPDLPGADFSSERRLAEDLVEANRLYRQTAALTGEPSYESVLEDLERILLEIAHAPDTLPADAANELRARIERQGLVFRVRVIESQLRSREEAAAPEKPSL